MSEKKLVDQKNELMNEYWTENFHLSLQELDEDDAVKIVESLDEDEINFRVNARRYQEDYIADYLEYLWEISPESFWTHVKATFNEQVGLLWSDNMFYFERLCYENIPSNILFTIVDYIGNCPDDEKQDLELLGCIVKSQVELHKRLPEIKNLITSLSKEPADIANRRVIQMTNDQCSYL